MDRDGAGSGPTLGTTGLWRRSMAVNVNATPPIAVIATTAESPISTWDTRNRRHAGSLSGSIMFNRIDQQGPSSL